jgi:ankyrin repeat protein
MPESQREITSTNPLFYASLLGLRGTIIYLLEKGQLRMNYTNEFNRTALQAAALKGRTLIVKLLLEKGADVTVVNREGLAPLSLASWNRHIEIIEMLLKNKADIVVATKKG